MFLLSCQQLFTTSCRRHKYKATLSSRCRLSW